MTTHEFISNCEEAWGGKVRLVPAQKAIFIEKLRRFSGDQIQGIFTHLLEETRFFPKVADAFKAAKELGYLGDNAAVQQQKAHAWEPSDCRLCAGSGMVAAFWTQEWEQRESGAVQVMNFSRIVPYQASAKEARNRPDDVRAIYRCDCDAGGMKTLGAWPRWSKTQVLKRERSWT